MTTLTANHSFLSKVNATLEVIVSSFLFARAARWSFFEAKKSEVSHLYSMANRYEYTQPNLAAELRSIASRG
jgi:hypothetical protein